MNTTIKNWMLGMAAAAVLLAAMHIANGPSEAETQAVQAADLADAQTLAQHEAMLARECHRLRGPGAVLLQIRDTDSYVCREGVIEPTPASVMQRYAQLGGGK